MRFFVLALYFFISSIAAHATDFLEPDQAFKFSAQLTGNGQIQVRYDIAPGYYLYRSKFKFALDGATLAAPRFPAGEIKQMPDFGAMEIYQHQVSIELPYTRTGAATIRLSSTAQGCAEAGICYNPITNVSEFTLPAQPPAAQSSTRPSALDTLSAGAAPGATTFLSPEQAFRLDLSRAGPDVIEAHFTIAPQYYLYRDKLHFVIQSPANLKIANTVLPAAQTKSDPNFGEMSIYPHDFTVTLRLDRPLRPDETVQVAASYQGCSEMGICYPPQKRVIAIGPGATDAAAPGGPVAAVASHVDKIERALQGGRFWVVIATFFGAGLLLALTPCVFPMIPILSGIIAGQRQVTRLSSFMLSLSYVLGMAITYALVGVAAALSGTLISNTLQNPVALSIGAAVFVALALSMFGLFELQLPSFIQSKFSDASNRIKGGNLVGVFIMGVLSSLIIGPCVAPPLAAALAYIAQTGNVALGGWALFSLAIGMGVPLLLLGLSAGALLPRAGGWMNVIKHFFGVLMLGVAIWLITPLIGIGTQMLLWSALLILSAIYWRALDPLAHTASGWQRLWKGLAMILLVAGIALLLGMLAGGRDVLQPLAIFNSAGARETSVAPLTFQSVHTLAQLNAKIAQAGGKPVMLDFYADWCISCKEMEHATFNDPAIRQRLENMTLLQADITGNTPDDDALRKRFGVFGPPAVIFFDGRGREITEHLIGYQTPDQFSHALDNSLNP